MPCRCYVICCFHIETPLLSWRPRGNRLGIYLHYAHKKHGKTKTTGLSLQTRQEPRANRRTTHNPRSPRTVERIRCKRDKHKKLEGDSFTR